MKDVVIVQACRPAIGAYGEMLRDINGTYIPSVTIKEALRRAVMTVDMIDDVRYGKKQKKRQTG